MAKKINDFGRKIGGARKDIWRARALQAADLQEMNRAEQEAYGKKDYVWPRPNWQELIASGEDKWVCYWKNEVRKALPAGPSEYFCRNNVNVYVSFVEDLRDAVMAVKTRTEAEQFFGNFFSSKGLVTETRLKKQYWIIKRDLGSVWRKFLNACWVSKNSHLEEKKTFAAFGTEKPDPGYTLRKSSISKYYYDQKKICFECREPFGTRLAVSCDEGKLFYQLEEAEEYARIWKANTWFLMDDLTRQVLAYNLESEAAADQEIEALALAAKGSVKASSGREKKPGKKRFSYPHLDRLVRVGTDWLHGGHATPARMMETFHFRGGEFGTWLSDRERQKNLDLAYEAFLDLAWVLGVEPSSLPFHENLSIAFGARGTGGRAAAAAHYEFMRRVINLTRIKGAGSLAHEWGHAFDHYLHYAAAFDEKTAVLASECGRAQDTNIPAELFQVLDTMIWSEENVHTQYYLDSKTFDRCYQKHGIGYWSSNCELFARAFACYVRDKLTAAGMRNDYLVAHAESHMFTSNGKTYYAYPRGEERTKINAAFDRLFEQVKQDQLMEACEK